jgi:hypothetical protein
MTKIKPLAAFKNLKLPTTTTVHRNIDAKLFDFRSKLELQPKQRAADDAMDSIADTVDNIQWCLDNDYKITDLLKQKVNALHRLVNNVQKQFTAGKSFEAVVKFLAFAALHRMERECELDKGRADDYILRRIDTFVFKTTTEFIADKTNTHVGSFRGKYGFYQTMMEAGFLLAKQNFDADGNENKDGRSVELILNTDWIFGFVFLKTNPRGNSTLNTNHLEPNKDNRFNADVENPPSETEINLKSETGGFSTIVKPTESETNQPTEEQVNPLQFHIDFVDTKSNEIETTQTANLENMAKNIDFVDTKSIQKEPSKEMVLNRWNDLKQNVYSKWNFSTNRIRVNAETAISEISEEEEAEAIEMLAANYALLRKDGETWQEVDERIERIIKYLAAYIVTHPNFYQYAPSQWLGFKMVKRTLTHYAETYLDKQKYETVKVEPPPSIPKPLKINLLDNTQWLIQKGAHESVIRRLIKSKGELLVEHSIRFAKAKLERGFYPSVGLIAYCVGVIRNAGHEIVIGRQADLEEAKLKQGLSYADEHAAPAAMRVPVPIQMPIQMNGPAVIAVAAGKWKVDQIIKMAAGQSIKLDVYTASNFANEGNLRDSDAYQMYKWLYDFKNKNLNI